MNIKVISVNFGYLPTKEFFETLEVFYQSRLSGRYERKSVRFKGNDIFFGNYKYQVYIDGVQMRSYEFMEWLHEMDRLRDKQHQEWIEQWYTKYRSSRGSKRRKRYCWYRHIKTYNEIKQIDEYTRDKRRKLPTLWDTRVRSDEKNWKRQRKTQYKTKGLGEEPNP